MSIAETLLPELDQEMATTRRVLERVPTDKGQWKPHPKSFSIRHLAQLVATMPDWITRTILDTEIDLAAGGGHTYEKTDDLLRKFDKQLREAREALAATKDQVFDVPRTLKHGPHAILPLPR